jgi:hypothetical protein
MSAPSGGANFVSSLLPNKCERLGLHSHSKRQNGLLRDKKVPKEARKGYTSLTEQPWEERSEREGEESLAPYWREPLDRLRPLKTECLE